MPIPTPCRAAWAAATLAGLLAAAAPTMVRAADNANAAVQTLHGVRYEPHAEVGGQKLRLNGAGTRYKAVFKVYTAGLYLEKPARSLQEIAALPGRAR